jgi:alkylhydroperoxidase family enzyme
MEAPNYLTENIMPRTAALTPDQVPADSKSTLDAFTKNIYTDANVMEIVALVAMYSLTNFFNNVFDPEKDFPAVTPAGSI